MAFVAEGITTDINVWLWKIMAATGRVPSVQELFRVSNKSVSGPWEEVFNNGPYYIPFYRLSPDQPTVTTTLNIEIDDALAYSAECYYKDNVGPNWDFLIGGNVFTTDAGVPYNPSAACMVAQNKIRLFGNDSCDIDYQIFRFLLN